MEPNWLDERERAAWVRFAAVVELLPGRLDTQLRRDSELSHYEYWVLSMLSEAPQRTLRMTGLAAKTNATLPRLSHVVARLEGRGFIKRFPCPTDGRATNATLTDAGWDKVVASAPGHVQAVRHYVIDALTPREVAQLTAITEAILGRVDPDAVLSSRFEDVRDADREGQGASS